MKSLCVLLFSAGASGVGAQDAPLLTILVDITDRATSTITAVANQPLVDQLSTGSGYNLINRFRFEVTTSGQFTGGTVLGGPICFECENPFPTPDLAIGGVFDSPPLGAFESEASVELANFSFTGDIVSFDVVGELSAAFGGGTFFPEILTFQTADGSAGDVPFEVVIVPAPAGAGLLTLPLLVRRRH